MLSVKAADDTHVYVRTTHGAPRYAFTGECDLSLPAGSIEIEIGAGFRHAHVAFPSKPISLEPGQSASYQVKLHDRRGLRRFIRAAFVGGMLMAVGGAAWAISDTRTRSPGSYILMGGGAASMIVGIVLDDGRGDKPKISVDRVNL